MNKFCRWVVMIVAWQGECTYATEVYTKNGEDGNVMLCVFYHNKKNKNHVILAVCCSVCHYYDLSLQLKQLPLSDMTLVVYFSFSFSASPTGWEGPWEKGLCLVTLFSWFLAQCLTQSRCSVNICQITQSIDQSIRKDRFFWWTLTSSLHLPPTCSEPKEADLCGPYQWAPCLRGSGEFGLKESPAGDERKV